MSADTKDLLTDRDVRLFSGMPMVVALEQDLVVVQDEQARCHRLGKVGFGFVGFTFEYEVLGEGIIFPFELHNLAATFDGAGVEQLVHVLEVVNDPVFIKQVSDRPESG